MAEIGDLDDLQIANLFRPRPGDDKEGRGEAGNGPTIGESGLSYKEQCFHAWTNGPLGLTEEQAEERWKAKQSAGGVPQDQGPKMTPKQQEQADGLWAAIAKAKAAKATGGG